MLKLRPFTAWRVTRRSLIKGAALVASGYGAKWLVDKAGDGEEALLDRLVTSPSAPTTDGAFIDVNELKKTLTVEQLNGTAEAYFASRDDWTYLLAKPLGDVDDAPNLLNCFSQMLIGLRLVPGMTVLDFGAGSCWASRWLTQLGMEAIALDVSRSALKIGRELYARHPVFGERPKPRFLHFDGHRIELPDGSVDRIFCFDTFHHLLNPQEVLREMSRVLKPGGIAGFSEPGPHHSLSPQSQYEMRNYRVLEDDVHLRRIWQSARQGGFAGMSIAVFSSRPTLLGLGSFEDYLEGGRANRDFADATRSEMHNRRMFFLRNGGTPPPLDSRSRAGLAADVTVSLSQSTVHQGVAVVAKARVKNTGRAIWLPHGARPGGVFLGAHLLDAAGNLREIDFFRQPLTAGEGRPVKPGEIVELEGRLPMLPPGAYLLEFDLVSESVGWFAMSGSHPVRLELRVL